jgi:hypothetical protein
VRTCCYITVADTGNRVIRKIFVAFNTIHTIVSQEKLAALPFHVLAAADGSIYFTDVVKRLYQYNGASGNVENITLGGDQSQLAGMAINPVDQKLQVLDLAQRVIYSVGMLGPFSSIPPTVSTSPDLGLSDLRTAAFNGTSTIYLGNNGNVIYTYSFSGQPDAWNDGTSNGFMAASGATARNVFFESAPSVAIDSSGNMLVGDANGCRVWLVVASTGKLRLVAGVENSTSCGAALTPDKPDLTQLSAPTSVVFGPDGTYAVIADSNNHRVLKVMLNCSGALESPSPSPSLNATASPSPSPSPGTSQGASPLPSPAAGALQTTLEDWAFAGGRKCKAQYKLR